VFTDFLQKDGGIDNRQILPIGQFLFFLNVFIFYIRVLTERMYIIRNQQRSNNFILIPNDNERRFKHSMSILAVALAAVLFFGYAIFARLNSPGFNQPQINIMVPWGLIALSVSFYLFKELNRVKKAKRDERREYINERRQGMLDDVVKKNKTTDIKNV